MTSQGPAGTPPQLSDDGRWWWDGQGWQPVPVVVQPAETSTSPWTVARGVLIAVIIIAVVVYVASYF